MRLSEREMKEILSRDVQVSDTVNDRLKDTYKMLKTEQKQTSKKPRRRFSYAAAAIAVVGCLVLPAGAYAASNLDFFDAMFGNSTKKSTPVIQTEQGTGKTNEDGTPKMTPITLPSHEFVSVDPQKAQDLTGGGCMSEPVEKQLGDHTLCIENMVYDQNGAVIYFTLERPGGVTMLIGNDDTNVRKGAYFSQERMYGFHFETADGRYGADNIYVDTERSTSDKMYCTGYFLWLEQLPETGDFPRLCVEKYPYSIKERDDKVLAYNRGEAGEEVLEELDEFDRQTEYEYITLTDKNPIPLQRIDQGDGGCLEYSPISFGVDLSKGFALNESEAYEPGNLMYLEIKYKDGSNYIVKDKANNIENSGYVLGGVGDPAVWYETMFNRIVDINEIQEIIVNGVTFPIEN